MNARRLFALSPFALLLVASSLISTVPASASGSGQPDNEVGPGLYRLDGHELALPVDDLEPLGRIVGNARFVGVGEPIHTSGGFYQLKARVFRYLVERQGFRVLGWEAPFFWVEELDAFLESCPQPAADYLAQNLVLFNTHRSTETAELLQWMCDWNQAHRDDRLHIYGFDIQRQALPAAEALIAYLNEVGVGESDPWVAGIRACDGVTETFFPARPFPEERYELCHGALEQVEAHFDQHKRDLIRATSEEELGWARVHLTIERAWQEQQHFSALGDFFSLYTARDRGMATLAEDIHRLRFRGERVMLWAHNGHLTRAGLAYVGALGLGDFLDESLGKKYKILGVVGSEIYANRAPIGQCGLQDLSVPGYPQVEDLFAALGEGALLADLDPRGNHPAFFEPGTVHAVADGIMVPAEGFDGMVYLPTSLAMHALPGVPTCP